MVTPETCLIGQIIVSNEVASALPLEHTEVRGQVTGMAVLVLVEQRFVNPLDKPAEMDYIFPLPQGAAVVDYEIAFGGRTIRGDLQEIEKARQQYADAREAGKRASLFEERRPNLFAVRLANVLPGETILCRMRYQERIKFDDGVFEFVFPMGLTPKYTSPSEPGEGEGVTPPIAAPGEKIGSLSLQVSIDAGVKVGDPSSPSHPIQSLRLDDRRMQIDLAGEQIPDHDFVLRYALLGEQVQAFAWTSAGKDLETVMAVLVPPRLDEPPRVQGRDFIFVLDRSGSMSGGPIQQARNALRACLRTLEEEDRFNILLFDDRLEWYKKGLLAVQQKEIEEADVFLGQVEGRGGTEIIPAIQEALQASRDDRRPRLVVFLTDGAVSAEARALEEVRRSLGRARLFTFGIGPSVNRALLSRLAQLGRGTSQFLQLNEDIEGAIIQFQDRVSFPMVTDLQLEWKHANGWDTYPQTLPDLYLGQPLEIYSRVKRLSAGAALVMKGKQAGRSIEIQVNLPESGSSDSIIERLWAKARIDDLMEQQVFDPAKAHLYRQEIIGLSLEHRLLTPYTAFVAVDEEIVANGEKKIVHIALPLPEGLEREGFEDQMLAAAPPPGMQMLASMMPPPVPMVSPSLGKKSASRKIGESIANSLAPTAALFKRSPVKHEPTSEFQPEGSSKPTGMTQVEALRWLARTQQLDGSWQSSTEMTAVGLIAFVRAGHTTRSGSFRKVVQRAFEWLTKAKAKGFEAFLCALAVDLLGRATQLPPHIMAAQTMRQALPAATSPLEQAVLACLSGQKLAAPAKINTMDDLRLAGLAELTGAGRVGDEIPKAIAQQDLSIAWKIWLS
ncbi:MAG TPA: VIT domain-containing protein [Anaerolineaceae bacterium]